METAVLDREHQGLAAEDRLSSAMGYLNVATARVVAAIAETIAEESWQGDGIGSVEQWVRWQGGFNDTRAARLCAAARKLVELPKVNEAFASGALTEDQIAVIARHTDPAHDGQVAELAVMSTVRQLAHVLPGIHGPDPEPEPDPEPDVKPDPELERPGEISFGYGDDGRFWSRADLPAEDGAILERLYITARDGLFRLRHPNAGEGAWTARPADISWADGFMHAAEIALRGLDGDAIAGRPIGERFQTIVHIDAQRRADSCLHLGPSIDERARKYLTCDCTIRSVIEVHDAPVFTSERLRTVSPKLRRLIEHRDGGCAVPGCHQKAWLHIHHLTHWDDGGPTITSNLVALCPHHHRTHHHAHLAAPTGRDPLRTLDHLELASTRSKCSGAPGLRSVRRGSWRGPRGRRGRGRPGARHRCRPSR
jgi:hypothetical protein